MNATPLRLGMDVSAVPTNAAGAGRYVIELLRRLNDATDLTLNCFSRIDDADRWTRLAPRANVSAITPIGRGARLLWEQTGFAGHVHRSGIDVLHSPHYTMPRGARIPVVVTMHDMFFFTHPQWHERSKVMFFRHAIKRSMAHADAVIAVSQFTADAIRERFPEREVMVIPHGVDHDRFRCGDEYVETDHATLELLEIPRRYILSVGTIEPRKNIPTLIRAFDDIANRDSSISLVIAGTRGWQSESFDQALRAAKHRNRIIVTGYVADNAIPALLRNARVVAYPAFAEGFGLPALESLACGAPLVTTKGSAMEEVCGDAACYVNPDDDIGMSCAIARLLEDQTYAETFRAIGPVRSQQYTWEKSYAAHRELYEKLRVLRH